MSRRRDEITNSDDLIDSRSVIERIEELESEVEERWTLKWSKTPEERLIEESFDNEEDAREVVSDLAHALSESLAGKGEAEESNRIFEIAQDILKGSGEGEFVFGPYIFTLTSSEVSTLDESEAEELRLLKELTDQSDYISDWHHGATLIRESYFKEYAMQFAEDIGAVSRDESWPHNCIDWEEAAAQLKMDFSSVEFGDVTYYVR